MTRMSDISTELLDEMTPAVRVLFETLLARNAELEKRVGELESRLNKTSKNSSKPPSSGHPHAKPEPPPKPKSKRKRGGQPGHDKFERTLIPSDECEDVIPRRPTECRGCGKRLRGSDSDPLREQVRDVEIKPIVTEYQLHRLTCRCGLSTCGELPETVVWPDRTEPSGQPGADDGVVPHVAAQGGLVQQRYLSCAVQCRACQSARSTSDRRSAIQLR
jgi:transposase